TPGLCSAILSQAPTARNIEKQLSPEEIEQAIQQFRALAEQIQNQQSSLSETLKDNYRNTKLYSQELKDKQKQLLDLNSQKDALEDKTIQFISSTLIQYGFKIQIHQSIGPDLSTVPGLVSYIMDQQASIQELQERIEKQTQKGLLESVIDKSRELLRMEEHQLNSFIKSQQSNPKLQTAIQLIEDTRNEGPRALQQLRTKAKYFEHPHIEILSFPGSFFESELRDRQVAQTQIAESIRQKYQTKIIVHLDLHPDQELNQFIEMRGTSWISLDPLMLLRFPGKKAEVMSALVHESIHARYGSLHSKGIETDMDLQLFRTDGAPLLGPNNISYANYFSFEEVHSFVKQSLVDNGKFIYDRLPPRKGAENLGWNLINANEIIATALKSLQAAKYVLKNHFTYSFGPSHLLTYRVILPIEIDGSKRDLVFHFFGKRPQNEKATQEKLLQRIQQSEKRIRNLQAELDRISLEDRQLSAMVIWLSFKKDEDSADLAQKRAMLNDMLNSRQKRK
ncbi:MAG TPA: hypothetical protein PLU50_07285, partial [Pseudobdellovibrionaceae bacterium]|nr:hypothetical protein [Pseudobdellovibrionaceae bacterium]